jgi:hypothetical protein
MASTDEPIIVFHIDRLQQTIMVKTSCDKL